MRPDDFIALAEATGAIVELDAWVLREACVAARVAIATHGERTIAVNVSPAHLDHGALVHHVEVALGASGLPPRLLTIEITEGMLIQDPESARSTLAALRALGVRLAIDDFGTGYSSLSQLRQFPPDVLKIDRSFVAEIAGERRTPVIGMILDLARSMGVDVVAEGIETAEQARFLASLGCQYGQGFYFGRPGASLVEEREAEAA